MKEFFSNKEYDILKEMVSGAYIEEQEHAAFLVDQMERRYIDPERITTLSGKGFIVRKSPNRWEISPETREIVKRQEALS